MSKKAKKTRASKEIDATTAAVHGASSEGEHIVGIRNLHVSIVQDGSFWFAQGLEIDYVAQGDTIDDARTKFEDGLAATIHENLRIHGTIEPMLQVAPQEVWKELLLNQDAIADRYSQVSVHQVPEIMRSVLPFQSIAYLELRQ